MHFGHNHDPVLMALSLLIAIQGSFVSLVLAREVGHFEGARRRLLLAMSAITLGSSIWAMHFIGMLAYHMPTEASYDLFLTLLSFLIAVLAVGIGYGVMTIIPEGLWRDVAAAIFTGGGIAGMHYVGMAAVTGPIELAYQSFWVAVSVLVGIVAAGISLHLAFGTKLQARAILGAVAMGLAISGMHYSAMYGTVITPTDLAHTAATHVLDRNLLAIVVAIVAFVICATSMLLLVPNRPVTVGDEHALAGALGTVLWERTAAGPVTTAASSPAVNGETHNGQMRIPAQSNGATVLLDPGAILAVRADGRYTHLQDGARDYFCNLSITELETRLDHDRFIRVHRSHIVQVRQVKSIRRKGDGAIVTVGDKGEVAVPVSRSALPKLKARLMVPEHAAGERQATILLS